jgi:hypothetical protein
VPGVAGGDRAPFTVGGPVRVDVATAVDAQAHQPPPDGRDRDVVAAADQLQVDGSSRPLVLAAPGLDQLDEVGVELGHRRVRDAGPVQQPDLPQLLVAGLPLGQALAGDTGLGGDVGDRAVGAPAHQPQPAGRGQRGVSVAHRGVGPSRSRRLVALPSCRRGLPLPHTPAPVTNLMSHNT